MRERGREQKKREGMDLYFVFLKNWDHLFVHILVEIYLLVTDLPMGHLLRCQNNQTEINQEKEGQNTWLPTAKEQEVKTAAYNPICKAKGQVSSPPSPPNQRAVRQLLNPLILTVSFSLCKRSGGKTSGTGEAEKDLCFL